VGSVWPFVGRDEELAAIADVRADGGCGVVVRAHAGIGKSRRSGALRYAGQAAAHAASSFIAEGQEGSARRAAAHSRRLFADGEGASQPPIDGLAGPATSLSAREAQLAELAAQGLRARAVGAGHAERRIAS
jgi:hypothetical protein